MNKQQSAFFGVFTLLFSLTFIGCSQHEFNGVVQTDEATVYNIVGLSTKNKNFELEQHRGKYIAISFGYTACPDVCPITLATLKSVYSELLKKDKDLAEKFSIIFVTVDPKRDDVKSLAAYLKNFKVDFEGVYVSDENEMKAMKEAYKVTVNKRYRPGENDTVEYTVDHAAGIYIINPEGKFVLYFPYGVKAQKISQDMDYFLSKNTR